MRDYKGERYSDVTIPVDGWGEKENTRQCDLLPHSKDLEFYPLGFSSISM